MRISLIAVTSFAGLLAATAVAEAHISVASGPATANKSQVIKFGVGHGCNGDDTFAITVDIPAGVTSVRPMESNLGAVSVAKDAGGAVTSVTYQKSDAQLLDGDIAFYEFAIRMKIPDVPFTQVFFPVHQTCKNKLSGTLTVVEWTALPGQTGEPAAALTVMPARQPGWNKYVIPADTHIPDPTIFFADAIIVWRGMQAFSMNMITKMLIVATPGVTEITDGIHPDQEIWVKY